LIDCITQNIVGDTSCGYDIWNLTYSLELLRFRISGNVVLRRTSRQELEGLKEER